MAGPASPGIDEMSIPAVCLAHGFSPPICLVRSQTEMNVVGHEAIGPYLDPGLVSLFGQEIAVDFVVTVFEENGLSPIAAEGDVVRGQPCEQGASWLAHNMNVTNGCR